MHAGLFTGLMILLASCNGGKMDRGQLYHPAEFEDNTVCLVWSTEYYGIVPRLVSALSQKDEVTLFVSAKHRDHRVIEKELEKYGTRLEKIKYVDLKGDYRNIWIRDYGPQYLVNRKGDRKLIQFQYFWTDPGFIADFAAVTGLPVEKSPLNSTGGAREVNGKGTMIMCEMHEMDVNQGKSRAEVEAEMKGRLGIKKVIWLKKGLPQDDSFNSGPIYDNIYPKGVHGHVDEFCRFAGPGTILLTYVSEEEAQQSPILAEAKKRLDENYRILSAATDQDGKAFRILKVPMAPLLIHDRRKGPEGQIIASVTSYQNFIISNSLIILPSYAGPETTDSQILAKEAEAEAVFKEAFPNRELVRMRADTINYYSGGFHCISIHQPD